VDLHVLDVGPEAAQGPDEGQVPGRVGQVRAGLENTVGFGQLIAAEATGVLIDDLLQPGQPLMALRREVPRLLPRRGRC
jgi:hypothetical protein